MRLMKKYNTPVVVMTALLFAIMLHGCNTTGCMDNRSSLPIAGFYSYENGAAISIDSISVGGIGAPNDSLLLAPGTQAQQVYLPFSSETDKVQFEIGYAWKYAPPGDILTFEYETIPYFVSEECGAMYRYRITRFDYTTNLLDSVAVADSLITNVERVNIKLYYRTETADEV